MINLHSYLFPIVISRYFLIKMGHSAPASVLVFPISKILVIIPNNPMTSEKINISTIPASIRGCLANERTPASPTIPMANPEASAANPVIKPAESNKDPLKMINGN